MNALIACGIGVFILGATSLTGCTKQSDTRSKQSSVAASTPKSVQKMEAASEAIDPTEIYIRNITYGGSGCPASSVSGNVSEDARAFTLLFSQYSASIGPGVDSALARRNCQVNLDIHAPAGYTYTLVSLDVRGFAQLEDDVDAEIKSTIYYQGEQVSTEFTHDLSGPMAEDYLSHREVTIDTEIQPCSGANRSLNINTEVRLDNWGNSNNRGSVTVDSMDGEFTQTYGVIWERCLIPTPTPTPTPPPVPTPNPNAPTATLPFHDDFARPANGDEVTGSWIDLVYRGLYLYNTSAVSSPGFPGAVKLALAGAVSDVRLEASVATNIGITPAADAGIMFRARYGDRTGYLARLTTRPGGASFVELLRLDGPATTQLCAAAVAGSAGYLRVDALNDTLRVYWNNNQHCQVLDSRYGHGDILMASFDGGGSFDNFDAQIINKAGIIPSTHYVVVGQESGGNGLVRIVDPRTGLGAYEFYPFGPMNIGVRVAMADINGDGYDDVITAAGPGGGPHVKIFDGRTGDLIVSPIANFFVYDAAFTGGIYVTACDLNHDGFADLVTGAGAGGGPHVRAYSGKNGQELASFYAYAENFRSGISVACGDVNGDSHADIITGAGPGGGPHVRVWSGVDYSELYSFYAYHEGFRGGVFVAAGDLNGDHRAEIITAAGAGGGPHVKVLDGRDPNVEMYSFYAFDPNFTGGVRVGTIDVDSDGRMEVLVSAGPGGGPHVRALDLLTGQEKASFYGLDESVRTGVYAAGALR